MKTDFPDQMLVSTSSGEGRVRTNSRLSGDNKYIAVELAGQQHSCPCGFVVLGSYQDLSIAHVLVSVWDRGNRCDKMVIGKRNTLSCIPLDRLRPLEGLQAFPPNSSPESVPGGAPPGFGADPGGKPADRLLLGFGMFDEIVEGHGTRMKGGDR